MEYGNLYREFISLFPDDQSFFEERCMENDVDEDEGMHIMFGFVIIPFLIKIVRESTEKSKIAFDYIEKMEKSNDSQIAEVVEFTILEYLVSNERESLQLYSKYFGEETAKAAEAVGKWYRK